VPAFYDSIEIARDRMFAKFQRRQTQGNPVVAFALTAMEAVAALLMVRGLYRVLASRMAGRATATTS
jgi:HAE1 family hydrophobic/amphiphilic exporter-1